MKTKRFKSFYIPALKVSTGHFRGIGMRFDFNEKSLLVLTECSRLVCAIATLYSHLNRIHSSKSLTIGTIYVGITCLRLLCWLKGNVNYLFRRFFRSQKRCINDRTPNVCCVLLEVGCLDVSNGFACIANSGARVVGGISPVRFPGKFYDLASGAYLCAT